MNNKQEDSCASGTSSNKNAFKTRETKVFLGSLISMNFRFNLYRFLELEPQTRAIFNYDVEKDNNATAANDMTSKMMIDMIDFAVSLLGPDLELIEEGLIALGRRHKKYGLLTRHLFSMEHAVIYALEEMLGDCFTRQDRRAWETIFQMVIKAMAVGMGESLGPGH